ncbi:MAG: hypothetical protein HONBIEJF_01425 [Fimbriimonadaceae bacterium]|nr:hypothetical protein [Fimbriimonadaceae bacterium]
MDAQLSTSGRRRNARRFLKLGLLGVVTTLFAVYVAERLGTDRLIEAEKRRLRELGIPITIEEYRRLVPKPGSASKYALVAHEIDRSLELANRLMDYGSLESGPLECYRRFAMALAHAHSFQKLPLAINGQPEGKEMSQEAEWAVTRILMRLARAAQLIAPFDSDHALRLMRLFCQVRIDLMEDAVLDRFTLTFALARCFEAVATVLDHHPHDLALHRNLEEILEDLELDDQRLSIGATIIADDRHFADIMSGAYQYTLFCEPEPTLAIRAYRSGVVRRDFDYRRWRIARIAAEAWVNPKLTAAEAELQTEELQKVINPESPLDWKGNLYRDLQIGFFEAHSSQMEITAMRNAALGTLWLSSERAKGAMPDSLPRRPEFMDPFTGEPLRYKLIGGKIFVYSLGLNGLDESAGQVELQPAGDDMALRRR